MMGFFLLIPSVFCLLFGGKKENGETRGLGLSLSENTDTHLPLFEQETQDHSQLKYLVSKSAWPLTESFIVTGWSNTALRIWRYNGILLCLTQNRSASLQFMEPIPNGSTAASCKEGAISAEIVEFPNALHPVSPNVNILHHYGTSQVIEARKLTSVQSFYLIYRTYLDFTISPSNVIFLVLHCLCPLPPNSCRTLTPSVMV